MTKTKKPLARSVAELVVIVAIAMGLAVAIQGFIVKPYEIPSASMEPTLRINQRILVDRVGMHFSTPHIGDIFVFHPPASETCADPNEGENRRRPGCVGHWWRRHSAAGIGSRRASGSPTPGGSCACAVMVRFPLMSKTGAHRVRIWTRRGGSGPIRRCAHHARKTHVS